MDVNFKENIFVNCERISGEGAAFTKAACTVPLQ